MKRIWLGLAAALALAGCAPGGGDDPGDLMGAGERRIIGTLGQVGRVLGGISSDDLARRQAPAPRQASGGFTPQEIAGAPTAYRIVQVNALALQEPARIIQSNGDEVTLALQSGPTAAFDGGILVATRGFGDDLMTMQSRGVAEALRAGGGTVARRMETLDAQDQIRTTSFSCTISPAGTESVNLGLREISLRRFDENCRSESLIFDNIYWLDGSGDILASRQYVSPTVAYLRSNVL